MTDYERIARVIQYIDKRYAEQPTLAQLAQRADLSESHFHRLFSRWAGVTPKEFLQCLTLAHAKQALRSGRSVLDAAYDAGLSGPGRLHDLCVRLDAASPGELKSGGAPWTIKASFATTPFGPCLIGVGPRGICHLSFVTATNKRDAAKAISAAWPSARITWDNEVANVAATIFAAPHASPQSPLRVFVRGTAFQVQVWRALLRIPRGALVSYGTIAAAIGDRHAARAVGAAVGQNQIAYLVPCHRVIRQTGVFSDYRWGATHKRAIVAWESGSISTATSC